MAETIRLGSSEGIELLFQHSGKKKRSAGLAWGYGTVYVAGAPVFSAEDGVPVEWTWIDLLEWLAKNWAYILCEQTFPFQMQTNSIVTLMRDLEQRWENMPEERVEEEEAQAIRFIERHDTATAFKGIYFPAVFLMRTGLVMEVLTAENQRTHYLPLQRAVQDLQAIGDGIVELLAGTEHNRAELAISNWTNKEDLLQQNALSLLTGLSLSSQQALQAQDENFWEYDSTAGYIETELMAAARMTNGSLSLTQQKYLLTLCRQLTQQSTDELDQLANELRHEFQPQGKPHDQGYWVAGWLRRKLKLADNQPAMPATLLSTWKVRVESFELENSKLDALACWGPKHGPAILINKSDQSTAAHLFGENSTLAHEICHLLLDRADTLPVAEVLNGHTPERLEKRARAFAAEFLLPRHIAAQQVKSGTSVEKSVKQLSEKYQVSETLVSWQVINSDVYGALNQNEQHWLTQHATGSIMHP
ncbi:ImmA/IrrE family metallo-endopeptidase [Nitrincola sp. MINF-07-Sa-05]|uniref:ImmA/IrrE family metallo-endopeptidase n=1 Tax=Nitrincola salilacus TaxID=3400273 RepID=UPI0039182575